MIRHVQKIKKTSGTCLEYVWKKIQKLLGTIKNIKKNFQNPNLAAQNPPGFYGQRSFVGKKIKEFKPLENLKLVKARIRRIFF